MEKTESRGGVLAFGGGRDLSAALAATFLRSLIPLRAPRRQPLGPGVDSLPCTREQVGIRPSRLPFQPERNVLPLLSWPGTGQNRARCFSSRVLSAIRSRGTKRCFHCPRRCCGSPDPRRRTPLLLADGSWECDCTRGVFSRLVNQSRD